MTIKRVVLPGFPDPIQITDTKLARKFERWNLDKKGTGAEELNLSDFQDTLYEHLKESEQKSFFESTFLGVIGAHYSLSQPQRTALKSFVGMAREAQHLSGAVASWGLSLSPKSSVLVIDCAKASDKPGKFGHSISHLTEGLHEAIHALSGAPSCGGTYYMPRSTPSQCNENQLFLTGFKYDERAIPDILRPHVRRVVDQYLASSRLLLHYSSIACKSENSKESPYEMLYVDREVFLWQIDPGDQNKHYIYTGNYPVVPCDI